MEKTLFASSKQDDKLVAVDYGQWGFTQRDVVACTVPSQYHQKERERFTYRAANSRLSGLSISIH